MKSNSVRSVLLFIAAVWLGAMPDSFAAENQASAGVKWVNPQLPAGPGLEHQVLHSTALGWDVGYVVWKPANYDPTRKYPVIYFLLINGEKDSPKAFEVLVKTFTAAGVEHRVVIHPNLEHNLGLYYEQSFETLMRFLGAHLKDPSV